MTERNYEDECGDHGGNNGDCGLPAGWGTDFESGKCRHCRGTSPDGSSHEGNNNAAGNNGGAPEGNTNSVSHGLYAQTNRFYQKVMSDAQRRLCDEIFQDYCTQFREVNGEPHQGELSRLFEVAVNHIKIIHSDNWAVGKPDELESGNPMVDKSQRYNAEGVPYQEYSTTVVLKGQQKLRSEDRKWLKQYDLLRNEDDEAQAAKELGDIARQALED